MKHLCEIALALEPAGHGYFTYGHICFLKHLEAFAYTVPRQICVGGMADMSAEELAAFAPAHRTRRCNIVECD